MSRIAAPQCLTWAIDDDAPAPRELPRREQQLHPHRAPAHRRLAVDEDDLSDAESIIDVITPKEMDWAISYSDVFDHVCLGVTGAELTTPTDLRPFTSVYKSLRTTQTASCCGRCRPRRTSRTQCCTGCLPEFEQLAAEHVVIVAGVLSTWSERRDWVHKMSNHADAGIPHYWRVSWDKVGALIIEDYALTGGSRSYTHIGTAHRDTGSAAVTVTVPFPAEILWKDLEAAPPV